MDGARQIELKKIFNERKLKQNWIASEVGLNEKTLSYQLNGAKDVDDEYYFKIKKLLVEVGILSGTPDEISLLTNLTIGLSGTIDYNMSLFSSEVMRAIRDGKITDNEKFRIGIKLDDLLENNMKQVQQIKRTLGIPI
jgi:hypothetical protein